MFAIQGIVCYSFEAWIHLKKVSHTSQKTLRLIRNVHILVKDGDDSRIKECT